MDHFVIKDHGRATRNRGCLINLPTMHEEDSISWELNYIMSCH